MNNLVIFATDSHGYRMAQGRHFSMPLPAVCAGVPGQTSAQVYGRIGADVIPYAPKVAVFIAGTNDVARYGNNSAHYLWAAADDCRIAGIKSVLVKVPPIGDWSDPGYYYNNSPAGNGAIQGLNAEIGSAVATLNAATPGCCEMVDLFTPCLNGDGSFNASLFLGDKVHFNDDYGYAMVAPKLRQAILDLLD